MSRFKGTATARITIDPSPEILMLQERLNQLVDDPTNLIRLMKIAVAQTFLVEYRKLWLQGLPEALHMRSVGHDSSARKATRDTTRALSDAEDALAEATAREDTEAVQRAAKRVKRLKTTMAGMLTGGSKKEGVFTSLVEGAMKIMALFTEVNALGVHATKKEITIGIGKLSELNKILTPTANRSGVTDSKMNILWRHLEFGTGIYSEDPEGNPDSPYKLRGGKGEWYWGPPRKEHKKRTGILIEGSMPIGALRLGNELAYGEQATRLDKVVFSLLRQALVV